MRHRPFIGCFDMSVLVTFLSVLSSVCGMLMLFRYRSNLSANYIDFAIMFLMVSGLCDMCDGFVARNLKKTDEQVLFGIQIDSLADVVSFVIFPIFILHSLVYKDHAFLCDIVSFLYVFCGLERLAWFNAHADKFDGYFSGLPVTFSAVLIPLMYMFCWLNFQVLYLVLYFAIAILFVLNIKIKKPSAKMYPVFVLLFVIISSKILFYGGI